MKTERDQVRQQCREWAAVIEDRRRREMWDSSSNPQRRGRHIDPPNAFDVWTTFKEYPLAAKVILFLVGVAMGCLMYWRTS